MRNLVTYVKRITAPRSVPTVTPSVLGHVKILHVILPKIVDFLSLVIYNTLMKQTFAIIVNTIALTSEREDYSPPGLCL